MAGFETTLKKYPSKLDSNVVLKVYEGHFATVHSHITKYFDFSTIKARRSEAMAAANILADKYVRGQDLYRLYAFVDTGSNCLL